MENSTKETVSAVINNLPVGTIMPYLGKPETLSALEQQGWFVCDGKSIDPASYPLLSGAIGNMYGMDGTKIRLPDLRGMFLRGVDGGAQVDPDAANRTCGDKQPGIVGDHVGTRQQDELKKHAHSYSATWATSWFHLRTDGSGWDPPRDVSDKTTKETGGNETRPKNVSVYYLMFIGLKKK